MKKVKRKVGKYDVGRTIGEGTFAKVKFAKNTETGERVAMKMMTKSTILKHKMVEQIKREISIMKIVGHPNIVKLHEVLASESKIYIILELVTGGELYDKIVQQGKLSVNEARRYFQQLIDAVAHCHSKGVYHRDLKPENLLLDAYGNLKVSDFGLSALTQQGDGLLHTTCGTPNYVAPEVSASYGQLTYDERTLLPFYLLNHKDVNSGSVRCSEFVVLNDDFCAFWCNDIDILCEFLHVSSKVLSNLGYDGAAADVWSCGVILYVLMAGYLPFEEADLPSLYKRIKTSEFTCPFWFPAEAKTLIHKILDPNPKTRLRIKEVRKDSWFRKNNVPVKLRENEKVNLDDVRAVFDDIQDKRVAEQSENTDGRPLIMNAFEMITLSQGLNLSALFDRRQDYVKRQTRFVSRKPASVIISSIEAVAESMGLKVHSRNYKMRLEGVSMNKAGQFAVVLEVFEVAPSLFMVDVRKAAGDTLEYHKFYNNFCDKLDSIIWRPAGATPNSSLFRQMTC
ncbi:hypothetical protein L6164_014333 [Bauhinia variegata]|uniref:Uncharacterized protein n=1 Tax=Bauhinia variegata TaxID=167791 RepID=A0ACB9NGX6_BAUVA|nr:hypothetical protein L6164_014333 [Bauhinia variegata]